MYAPLDELYQKIQSRGGFVNAHAHLDRAWSVTRADFSSNISAHLHEKWRLVEEYKSNTSTEKYFAVIKHALKLQQEAGVHTCLSFIDCDSTCGDKAITAALEVQKIATQELGIKLLIANQTLKGILPPEERPWFEKTIQKVDIIGSLPAADKGREGEHLDLILSSAKALNKRVHVHVDQLNSPYETETELLCRKTMEHHMEGMVAAIHGISIAAHPQSYRTEVYKMARDAGIVFIACPTAWIDCRRSEVFSPTHNAITPIDEMLPAGLKVALGSDNIADIFKPFANGDMRTELRFLLEATHWYNTDDLLDICTYNGLFALGLT